jgi:murein DD-endopeptidase MepM/ murein hydrolase activator NlpD
LSSFGPGIRAGTHVSQGDLIGRVGQSGLATGPHLDYRVLRNGVYVNPVTAFRGMPEGDPIPADRLDEFGRRRDTLLLELQTRLAASETVVPVAGARAD